MATLQEATELERLCAQMGDLAQLVARPAASVYGPDAGRTVGIADLDDDIRALWREETSDAGRPARRSSDVGIWPTGLVARAAEIAERRVPAARVRACRSRRGARTLQRDESAAVADGARAQGGRRRAAVGRRESSSDLDEHGYADG